MEVPDSTRRRVSGPVFRWFALASFVSMIVIVRVAAMIGVIMVMMSAAAVLRYSNDGTLRTSHFIKLL